MYNSEGEGNNNIVCESHASIESAVRVMDSNADGDVQLITLLPCNVMCFKPASRDVTAPCISLSPLEL